MNRAGDWHGGGRKHKLRTKGGRTEEERGREREREIERERGREKKQSKRRSEINTEEPRGRDG